MRLYNIRMTRGEANLVLKALRELKVTEALAGAKPSDVIINLIDYIETEMGPE